MPQLHPITGEIRVNIFINYYLQSTYNLRKLGNRCLTYDLKQLTVIRL